MCFSKTPLLCETMYHSPGTTGTSFQVSSFRKSWSGSPVLSLRLLLWVLATGTRSVCLGGLTLLCFLSPMSNEPEVHGIPLCFLVDSFQKSSFLPSFYQTCFLGLPIAWLLLITPAISQPHLCCSDNFMCRLLWGHSTQIFGQTFIWMFLVKVYWEKVYT